MTALFVLGQTVGTPGALNLLQRLGVNPLALLQRHVSGDWGDLEPEDVQANQEALRTGGRIFSAYRLGPEDAQGKIWVITEADRSATCLLLPEEY